MSVQGSVEQRQEFPAANEVIMVRDEIERSLAEVQPKLEALQDTVATAADRMRRTLPPNMNETLLTHRIYRGQRLIDVGALSSERIWFTDRPHQVMPTETLYHVTSSLALDALANNGRLIPPFLHDFEGVVTHRGFGQKLLTTLLQLFGADLGENDKFLWLGANVDMEQVEIENIIGGTAGQINQDLFETIFDPSRSGLNEHLRAVVQCLERGERPGSNAVLQQYIEKLMAVLYRLTGVRDGWYDHLKSSLLGDVPVDRRDLTTIVNTLLDLLRIIPC